MSKLYHTFVLLLILPISQSFQEDGGRYSSSTAILLLFVYGTILAGVVLRYLIEACHIPIPFQVFILILGIIVGYIGGLFRTETGKFLGTIEDKNEYLLIIALPILVYKLCLCLEVHSFMRCILQVLIVAIPCTFVNGILVGFIMRLVENSSNWSYQMAIMYGFTCVAIYPHETLLKLKELGAKGKHLSDLLEGEAIFGTAMCVIMILAALQHQSGYFHSAEDISIFIFQFLLGGFVLGCVSGFILSRLMKMFYNDAINIMIISISAPFIVYYIGIYVLHTCGILSLIVVGMFMSLQRAELPPDIDSSLNYFWELVVLIMDSVVFAVNGVVVGLEVVQYLHFSDVVKIVIAYMVIYFVRSATFILFSTILSRLEYGISFRHMVMAAWGGLRGAVSLCLVMISFQGEGKFELFKGTVLVHINGVVFLSLLINVPTIPYLLDCLGISNLSMARQHNMNNCVHHIMAKRDRVIALLKMDRFLSDANWSVVDSSTIIKHPYKGNRDADTERDSNVGFRGSLCPDCHKEVASQPTQKEMKEMRREARMRILKAKKISYSRQYENGMLSKDALTALTHAVEIAQNNEENYLRIDSLLRLFRKKMFLQQVKNYLTRYFHTNVSSHMARVPRKLRRRTFYKVYHHPVYICITYIMNILSICSSGYELTLTSYEGEFIEMFVAKALNLVFFMYFLCDMALKIYGMSYLFLWQDGVKTYFRDWWHVLDLLLIIIGIADLSVDVLDILRIFMKYESFQNKTTIFLKLLRILRLLRIITLCKIVYPLITRFCDMKIDAKVSTVYDIGKGFVKGEEEVLGMLDQMIPNSIVRQEMRQTMENDKLAVTKELGLIQKEKPWIAITVKTKQAIRTILNNMEAAIDDLRSAGWIDHIEYKKLIESLNDRRKFVRRMKMINSCPPKVIFQEIIWIADEAKLIDFLFDQITTKIYDPGDVVCAEGQKPPGVIIIITGLFKTTYYPEKKVLDSLQSYGALPVIDYISSIKFDRNIEDYIVSGNSIGELSYLTGRTYNASVVADTPCQVYILPTDLLEDAAKLSANVVNGLKARMWKYVSLKLALCILLKTPAYVACSQERLRVVLERSFVPNLENFSMFINNTMIEDIILIEGIVVDDHTKENFIAPCYIPRTAQKLILVKNVIEELGVTVNPKLLVIPSKEVDSEDIMEAEEDMSEMYQKNESAEFPRTRSSRSFRRRRRVKSSFADSAKSPRMDFSDATSYTRSAAFSNKSTPTAREFELPDFRRRSLVYETITSQTNTLQRYHSRDGHSEGRDSIEMVPANAERHPSSISRKSLLRITTSVPSKQSQGRGSLNELREEEDENKENIGMKTIHPFSIEEESSESLRHDNSSFHKDIP